MTKDNNELGNFKLEGIPPARRGIPQIEVSFDVDANGIMNIEAKDKGSGNIQNITIKNDKGRLSAEYIDRMVQEAETYKDEDNLHKATIEARNQLEALVYQTKSCLENPEVKSKLEDEDLEIALEIVRDTEMWIETPELTKEDYETKLTEINGKLNPIMTKIYSQEGSEMPGSGSSGSMPSVPEHVPSSVSGSAGATIDEVD